MENNRLSAVKLAEKIGVASRNIENNIKKLKEFDLYLSSLRLLKCKHKESILLRRKAEDFSVMRTGKWRKRDFILSKINSLKIYQIRISKKIRQETDRIIIVLKMRVSGYTGWQPGECISDTGYVSDYRGIHRTRIYNRWKSSDADEWAHRQRDRAESKKSYGDVEAWCQVHANAAGCHDNIGETIYGYYKKKRNDQCYNYIHLLGITHRILESSCRDKFRLCTGPESGLVHDFYVWPSGRDRADGRYQKDLSW